MDKLIEIQSELDQLIASLHEAQSFANKITSLDQSNEFFRIISNSLDSAANIGEIIQREDEDEEK